VLQNECSIADTMWKTFSPKMLDVTVAVTVGVIVSVYKLGPLLKDITEKERMQLEQRKQRLQANSPNSLD
jgi:hypothetical protein